MATRPSRIDLLELDIDLRLAEQWQLADEWFCSSKLLELAAPFMRAGYGKGYCDALAGKLFSSNPPEHCVDRQLGHLWVDLADATRAWRLTPISRDAIAGFTRASYLKGHHDAQTEEDPGQLCRDHGYRVPYRHLPRAA